MMTTRRDLLAALKRNLRLGNAGLALRGVFDFFERTPRVEERPKDGGYTRRDVQRLAQLAIQALKVSPRLRGGPRAVEVLERFEELKAGYCPRQLLTELRSLTLSEAPEPPALEPGQVGCLLVSEGSQGREAYLRRLSFQSPEGGAGLVGRAARGCRNAKRLMLDLLPEARSFAHHLYAFLGGLEEPVVHGPSLGLPAALAFASRLWERPLPSVYATGEVKPDGRVVGVGEVRLKVEAALREQPGPRTLMVPAENLPELAELAELGEGDIVHGVATLNEALQALFEDRFGADDEGRSPAELLARAEDLVKERRYHQALSVAERLRRNADQPEHLLQRFEVQWWGVVCLLHLGRHDEAERWLQAAEEDGRRLREERRIGPHRLLLLAMNHGRVAWGRFQYERAALAFLDLARAMEDHGALAEDEGKVHGSLSELYAHMGRGEEAIAERERAQACMPYEKQQHPRNFTCMADLRRRKGQPELAWRALEQAERAQQAGERRDKSTDDYMDLCAARLLRSESVWEPAVQRLRNALNRNPPLYPRCLLLRELGVALWELGEREEARESFRSALPTEEDGEWSTQAALVASTATLEWIILASGERDSDALELCRSWLEEVPGGLPDFRAHASVELRALRAALEAESLDELASAARGVLGLIPW